MGGDGEGVECGGRGKIVVKEKPGVEAGDGCEGRYDDKQGDG